jgi:exonuclease SbcC
MRVHRVEVEAFGPFVARQDVDFDALGAGGLFLVHGATGAGKTSLLDAVCFALFADVPGDRQARGLRSDLAGPQVPACVVLEFSAGGRRLRIERQAEFQRPKRRGSGVVTQPSRVRLDEFVGGAWGTVSTRIDEAAEVVHDLIGMGLAQFRRVALLPQGDFAAFLKATPEDRRRLLERLFDVSRFTDVEEWLTQRRRGLGHEVAQRQAQFDAQIERLRDLLAGATPAALDLATIAGWDDPASIPLGRWLAVAKAVSAAAEAATMRALEVEATAELHERAARQAQSAAEASAALRRRGELATQSMADLTTRSEQIAADGARLAAAARAAAAGGELRALTAAAAREASARAEFARTAAALGGETDLDLLATALADAGERLADAARAVAEAEATRDDLRHTRDRRDSLDAEVAPTSAVLADLAMTLSRERTELAALTALAAQAPEREWRHAQLLVAVDLFRDGATTRRALVDAREEERLRRDAWLSAREALVTLQQARLTDLAGELSGHLRDGEPCPVCGSQTHPTPQTRRASWSPDALTAADDAVQRCAEQHTEIRSVIARHEATLESVTAERTRILHTLDLTAATTAAEAARLVVEASARVRESAEAATARATRGEVVSRLVALEEEAQAGLAASKERIAAEAALAGELTERCATQLRRAWELLSVDLSRLPHPSLLDLSTHRSAAEVGMRADVGTGAVPGALSTDGIDRVLADVRPRVDTDLSRIGALARQVAQARDARDRLDAAAGEAARARVAFEAALAASGFDDRAELESAWLSADDRAGLETDIRTYAEALAVARATLAEPEVVAALADPEPVDVAAARLAHDQARAAHLAATRDQVEITRMGGELSAVLARIVDQSGPLERVRTAQDEIAELADLVCGGGANNVRRMRLSAFVLAARLERVVALANERLALMDQGRFRLEHDSGRAARGARSGLGLVIHDDWTGVARPPATLSGGESFMASLALALGLADAIRETSGGQEIQTLFVDEGFGSLDEESLEQVMGVLDALRDGGRAVGVVSHLGDLRDRIPARLEVVKSPQGSTVRQCPAIDTRSA